VVEADLVVRFPPERRIGTNIPKRIRLIEYFRKFVVARMEEEAHACIESLLFLSEISEAIETRPLTEETQRLLIAHEGRMLWETRQFKKLCERQERGF
jgi:hypothetical protein